MRATQENKEHTAYHEAGHAIMAYLIGRKVLEVQIFLVDDLYHGRMRDDSVSFNLTSPEQIEKSVYICYAGEIAEIIKYGSHEDPYSPLPRWFQDVREADRLLNKYFSPDEKEKQKYLIRDTVKRLLVENWPRVERLTIGLSLGVQKW